LVQSLLVVAGVEKSVAVNGGQREVWRRIWRMCLEGTQVQTGGSGG